MRRLDAGRAPGRAEIDRHDARVWMRRADDAAVEHAGPGDVERVLRAAGDLVRAVEALDRRADHGSRGRPVVIADRRAALAARRRARRLAAAAARRRVPATVGLRPSTAARRRACAPAVA